mgnify:CR=1 FL=1
MHDGGGGGDGTKEEGGDADAAVSSRREMNGRKRRAKMEISREEERAAMAARSIHSLLPKLILLALRELGLLLDSLPALPSLVLLRELKPPVAFHLVRTRGRARGRGREVIAVLVRGVTVPREES